MTEVSTDDDFGKELAEAFAADEAEHQVTPAAADVLDAPVESKVEEPKKDEPAAPTDPSNVEEPAATSTDPAQQPPEPATSAQDPKEAPQPQEPAAPQSLTKEDVVDVISRLRNEERASTQDLQTATSEVLEAFYPEGLSNVLVDQTTSKELRSPQDVVDASGGDMSMEQAQQWLLNEQYKLDQNIAKIKNDAQGVAETTIKFKQDSIDVLQRYSRLFEAYPAVQSKVWDQYSKLVKADEAKGVILSAPDMREFYDTMLEPYRLAFEFSHNQSATNATTPPAATPPAPVTPGINDRMDEGGDGGVSPVDDPNDFAQQVTKALAEGF